jgi:hypothetical protein
VLKDQNIQLKKHKTELETDIKVISTKLQRYIKLMRPDKTMPSKELDDLLDEQMTLKEQEVTLNKRVLGLKRKQDAGLYKTAKPVISTGSLAKPRGGSAAGKNPNADLLGVEGGDKYAFGQDAQL